MRKAIFQTCPTDLIKLWSEMAHNVLNGNIKITPKDKKALQSYKKYLRLLRKKKSSLALKRRILIQKGGFVGALATAILSALASSGIDYAFRKFAKQ